MNRLKLFCVIAHNPLITNDMKENKELESITHSLACQAAARAGISAPYIRTLDFCTVQIISPNDKTDALMEQMAENFVFLSCYQHNSNDFLTFTRPLYRAEMERQGERNLIIEDFDKKEVKEKLEKHLENAKFCDSLTLCRRSVSIDGGEFYLPLYITSYCPYSREILKADLKLPLETLTW